MMKKELPERIIILCRYKSIFLGKIFAHFLAIVNYLKDMLCNLPHAFYMHMNFVFFTKVHMYKIH